MCLAFCLFKLNTVLKKNNNLASALSGMIGIISAAGLTPIEVKIHPLLSIKASSCKSKAAVSEFSAEISI